MQHFNEDFVSIISMLHVSALIGHLQVLFIYANILKAMAIGHLSYQSKLRVAIVVRYKQKHVKNIYKLF
jgi:predicted ATP-grasp superfamily ATP-dependent carboligase